MILQPDLTQTLTSLALRPAERRLALVDPDEPSVAPGLSGERLLLTVLFTDIVGSTELAARLGDSDWLELLDEHDAIVRRLIRAYGGRELQSTGDGFVAAFSGPGRAIEAACAIRSELRELGVEIRAGLHTGECEVRSDGSFAGIALSIGARVSAAAAPDEVLVSSTVKDVVAGSPLRFSDRGEHALKGIPSPWHLYAVAA